MGSPIRRPYRPRLTGDGGAVLDAEALAEAVFEALDALAAHVGPEARRVRAVGLSAFWHSLVGTDERGAALTPVYLWMDGRGAEAAEALRRTLDQQSAHGRTGCVLHESYPLAKLAWLRGRDPRAFERVRHWMAFGDFLLFRLFGRARSGLSMASGSGLLDTVQRAWDDSLLKAVGLSPDRLPPLVDVGEPFVGLRPEFASRWPAWAQVPWLPPVGDGGLSNLGAGCATRERLGLMVGTSGALRVLWRAPQPEPVPWGVWSYRLGGDWICQGGALNDGGSLRTWLRETLAFESYEAVEAALASGEPDGHGLTVLPMWGGERSPGWSGGARGAVTGLHFKTTRADLLRAALESVALWFARILRPLGEAVPEATQLVATGGALLHSPAWMQIMADVLGRPLTASAVPEASSRGAALWALDGVGALPQPLESMPAPMGRVFTPVAAHTERYRAAAERQERLYRFAVE